MCVVVDMDVGVDAISFENQITCGVYMEFMWVVYGCMWGECRGLLLFIWTCIEP